MSRSPQLFAVLCQVLSSQGITGSDEYFIRAASADEAIAEYRTLYPDNADTRRVAHVARPA